MKVSAVAGTPRFFWSPKQSSLYRSGTAFAVPLLSKKEEERRDARKNWKTIHGIKELKEGFLSQAVDRICKLAIRYQAIIVMENLNSGFKNVRSGVESSVYQKFETMLANKLSFLVEKKKAPTEAGGVRTGLL